MDWRYSGLAIEVDTLVHQFYTSKVFYYFERPLLKYVGRYKARK